MAGDRSGIVILVAGSNIVLGCPIPAREWLDHAAGGQHLAGAKFCAGRQSGACAHHGAAADACPTNVDAIGPVWCNPADMPHEPGTSTDDGAGLDDHERSV